MRRYERIVVFDLETTGLDFRKDRIIEFGAVVLEKEDTKFKVKETINHLINPGFEISEKITEITGITNDELRHEGINEIDFHMQVRPLFVSDVKTLLVAYNANFDVSFMVEMELRLESEPVVTTHDLLDVMAIYKDLNDYPHRLVNAIETLELGDIVVNSHRASDDALATWEVLKKLYPKCSFNDYINVFGYNRKYKFNGVKLPQVTYLPVGWGKLSLLNQIKRLNTINEKKGD